MREIRGKCFVVRVTVLLMGLCFLYRASTIGGEIPTAPQMPGNWTVISDLQVPAEQVEAMSRRLGGNLSNVRNTVYDVGGKRVQINVIVAPDPENAGKLMTKLRSMKIEKALLQEGLTIYEFVGQNDVLPLIEEGRRHLHSR